MAFTLTINGVSLAPLEDGHVPSYRVRPGEYLVMRVAVTVPARVTIAALWFGISAGSWGNGPSGPIGMNPILAHSTLPLSAGLHTFGLHWRIPNRQPGTSLYLIYTWSSHRPDASVSGAIAVLAVPGTATGSYEVGVAAFGYDALEPWLPEVRFRLSAP